MRLFRCIAVALLLLASVPLTADEQEPAALAEQAAMEWLAQVDAGRYAESWSQSSALLQQQVSQDEWVHALTVTRQPLGELGSRELMRVDQVAELPNLPAGDYVVLQFKTRFAERESAAEMTTLALEDGAWEVAGYFIR